MRFRDVMDIEVRGGRGGDGAMSFLRLKYLPKGGPDGGHGGRGGHVWLEAVDELTGLDRLTPGMVYRGGNGKQGEGRERHGADGEDRVLQVPVGTVANDADDGQPIADLLEVGQRVRVARGGEGGRGNASFATSERQAPRFAEYGEEGERRRLRLELRTIADVGLVGYPNAGKSSLLTALSNARPKVADYPFTTLTPHLGVVARDPDGLERLTIADIPGIVEDAHLGKGLGLDFLRHIGRTRLLAFVLDVAEEPAQALLALRRELEAFEPKLLERPALIVLNKTDLAGEGEVAELEASLARYGLPVLPVSALEGAGLEALREALFALLPDRAEPAPATPSQRRVVSEPVRVERDRSGTGWVVRGREAERLVERFDARNPQAVAYLQRHFESLGLTRLLRDAGAQDGDDVTIGEATFEWFDERASATRDAAVDDAEGGA